MRYALFLLIALAAQVTAHDVWLDASSLRPALGETVEIYARGGHYFPSSELAPADRVVFAFTVDRENGDEPLESQKRGKERLARISIETARVHRVALELRRPNLDRSDAWATLLIVPQGAEHEPAEAYIRGKGLEIVPRESLATARRGQAIAFSVLRDGTAIPARVQILAAERGTTWLDSTEREPAIFTPKKAGRHLALANDGGQTATLVFDVAP